jgi:aldehyde:ferredoxin oxidoreductase
MLTLLLANLLTAFGELQINVSKRLLGVPPQTAGPNKGVSYDIEKLKKGYWKEIGWDSETGIPTEETLAALDLTDLVKAGGVL